MKRVFLTILLINIFATISESIAQAPVNPDISFIGDMRLFGYRNALSDEYYNKLKLNFEELEIAGSGYLNPYSRADVTLGIGGTGGEIDIEEAFATLVRGLPLNLQVKAGQYLVDFGMLNTQHPHQWSWIQRPLMHQWFFGEEGLKDIGIDVTTLIPVGNNALTISANLLQGDFLLGEDAGDIDHNMGGSGRISLFSSVGATSSLEIGVSGLYGQSEPDSNRWATMGDFDFKYKWRPDVYHSLVIVGESMVGSRKIDGVNGEETNSSFGAFSAVDYQFRRRYNAGAFVDYSQMPDDNSLYQIGYGAFAGFSLAEETYRISLMLRQDDGKDFEKPFQTVILQLLWSLGPHKPHQF